MLNCIITTVLAVIGVLIFLGVAIHIAVISDNVHVSLFRAIQIYLVGLFKDRNLFGILLSSIVAILSIPSILLGILLAVLAIVVSEVPRFLWTLGAKKS